MMFYHTCGIYGMQQLKVLLAYFTKSQNCDNFVMHFTQKPSENSKTDYGKLCQPVDTSRQTPDCIYLYLLTSQ